MANSIDCTRVPPHLTSQSHSDSELTSQALTPNTESSGQLEDREKWQVNNSPQDLGYSKE